MRQDEDTSAQFKGRFQQLFALPAAFNDHDPTGVSPLPEAGQIGTNRAFLQTKQSPGMQWYEGVEKSRVQMLARPLRFQPGYHKAVAVPLPDAGGLGTDKAFLHMGDGTGQSTKGSLQQLFDIDGPQVRLCRPDPAHRIDANVRMTLEFPDAAPPCRQGDRNLLRLPLFCLPALARMRVFVRECVRAWP